MVMVQVCHNERPDSSAIPILSLRSPILLWSLWQARRDEACNIHFVAEPNTGGTEETPVYSIRTRQ